MQKGGVLECGLPSAPPPVLQGLPLTASIGVYIEDEDMLASVVSAAVFTFFISRNNFSTSSFELEYSPLLYEAT